MRSAFTLTEVLVVAAITGVVAAISYPVVSSARREGSKSACTSNLAQLSKSTALYRADNGGDGTLGGMYEMGLPPSVNLLPALAGYGLGATLKCRETPKPWMPREAFHYHYMPLDDRPSHRKGGVAWRKYVSEVGEEAVLFIDVNHNDESHPFLNYEFPTFALGVKLNGSVQRRFSKGNPEDYALWRTRE
ncbi:MAG: prepilin-type N-terminal cleavage/methylation domain-containing protein [Fimbriimonadaceae bacterium]|nr:prepilin-type N-terminal cleavage/methylation domain-containing protein [Fimbriimonadaceae bacterium]QYK56052.1 MAG: prepilin-type N-terminal cleavage/methylation domain-containing protein [Fimbriimonadaceae bacterium]